MIVHVLLLGIAVAVFFSSLAKATRPRLPPTILTPVPILSLFAALKFVRNSRGLLQRGYNKYKGGTFRVPEFQKWRVIVTSPRLVEELRKSPEDALSFDGAFAEILQTDYTIGPNIQRRPYHLGIIRHDLTRKMSSILPDVHDEVVVTCNELIQPSDEWVALPGLSTMMKVISRSSNRVFVGLPKCRDPDYTELCIKFTVDVAKAAIVLNIFPKVLRPLAAKLFTSAPSSIQRGNAHLVPIIHERYKILEEYGPAWEGKPNDMLSWLMDSAEGEEKEAQALALRVLSLNFASIHTTSMSATHALFHLASSPEYLQPLREEIQQCVKEDGWSKAAVQKMQKMDSFVRESLRFHGIGQLALTRRAMRDYSLSDGTLIAAGSFVSAASWFMHHDNEYYEDANTFKPWRFANINGNNDEGAKHQASSTSPEYMAFGHGKHACPGRFFAVNELKVLLAHLVMTYDMKLENEGKMPDDFIFHLSLLPDPKVKVLFRRRRA
ncbi:cytochrome P450 [Panus rudis PR-1116 ss-1]|nr:cytochrome P450 [Panus rudis PR-1116 ss-1]